jgi:hypothetical protein
LINWLKDFVATQSVVILIVPYIRHFAFLQWLDHMFSVTDSHSFVVTVRGKLFFKDSVGETRLTDIEIIVFQRKTQGDWL